MYLPTETVLHNRYSIEQVIGQGGFGVTYLARDLTLHVKVAVKEYLPRQLASRAEGQAKITVYTGEAREHFEYGLKKFLEEARSVAKFANHPNIVSARDYFEENGTAYMVMEYIEGETFKQFLEQKGGRIPFELASQIMMPVMDALREVHVTGLLHRDISPDNVYITADGRVKLLDFGAARYFAGEQSKSLSVILKTGYAPEEQYRSSGKQGAWTDVYATAATMYRAITGRIPPDALDRKEEDTLEPPSRLGVAITPAAEQALMKALAVNAQSRFQDLGEFQAALRSEAIMPSSQTALVSDGVTQPYQAPPQWSPVSTAGQIPAQPGPMRRKKGSTATAAIIISVAVFVLVGSGVIWYFSKIHPQAGVPQGQTGPAIATVAPGSIPAPSAPAVAPPTATPPAVRALVPTPPVPAKPSQYVVDLAGVIDANTQVRLNALLKDLEATTTAQVMVLTIKSLDGETIENFSRQTAVKWGIGQKGKDNGVLLTVAVKDHKYRIEVGYGLESTLPDSLVGSIGRQYLVPNFRKGDYASGLLAAVTEVINKIAAGKVAAMETTGRIVAVGPNPAINQPSSPTINSIPNSEARKFVQGYLRAASNNDLKGVINSYAEVVNYFKKGPVNKKFIKDDKTAYALRFPYQQHELAGDIDIKDITNELKVVKFRENFVAKNSTKMFKGIAENTWQIKKIDSQFKIVKEEQQVVRREEQ